jgi:hypothetical protein
MTGVLDMAATTIGYPLAGLIAAGIIFIGARFIVAPRIAAAGYGVQADLCQPSAGAYLSVKGVRDIASGLFVFILMAAGATHVLGWIILAATIIPIADATIRPAPPTEGVRQSAKQRRQCEVPLWPRS